MNKYLYNFSAILAGTILGLLIIRYLGWFPTKTVLVSSRMEICEQKGGKYGVTWIDFENKYVESCRTQEKDIEL